MAFQHLSCEQLKQWLEDENKLVNIIDIRDAASFNQGHIENAEHIDNQTVALFIGKANPSTPLVVCCYHGNSSQGAADYFNQQGFDECYSLEGGYEVWRTLPL